MADPITFYISAAAFVITAILIIFFLIKEGYKHFNNNKDSN